MYIKAHRQCGEKLESTSTKLGLLIYCLSFGNPVTILNTGLLSLKKGKKKDLKNGYGYICLRCDNYDLLYCSVMFPTALHLSSGHVSFLFVFCDASKQNCRL